MSKFHCIGYSFLSCADFITVELYSPYGGFILFPLFVFLLYRKMGDAQLTQSFFILLVASLVFAGIYGAARIPGLNQLPVLNQLGFCQRISFFFNYLPIVWLSILHIRA